jgi:hypothetical protein
MLNNLRFRQHTRNREHKVVVSDDNDNNRNPTSDSEVDENTHHNDETDNENSSEKDIDNDHSKKLKNHNLNSVDSKKQSIEKVIDLNNADFWKKVSAGTEISETVFLTYNREYSISKMSISVNFVNDLCQFISFICLCL